MQTTRDMGFSQLYDDYFARVYNYVRYRVEDAATADDVVSGVFERILGKMDTYRPERGPLDAWVFAVARNGVNDHFRSRRWRSWLPLDLLPERASREPEAPALLEEEETRRALTVALRGLDDRERDLLGLRFGTGISNREIASMTGLTESNVGVILHRAVKRLQAAMGGTGGGE
ncbi:MAG: hypothetical protein A2X36_05995 [Elusimicrobia bacterium GWA2_69_24]|nr:MAG: hypothetical protein A2X36_05995 [Elusimicrobia bacterium GWA2_69_24]HBL15653.1 RNA polymerase subunit sigma-24 [Elusimicrobiota bacterium]